MYQGRNMLYTLYATKFNNKTLCVCLIRVYFYRNLQQHCIKLYTKFKRGIKLNSTKWQILSPRLSSSWDDY